MELQTKLLLRKAPTLEMDAARQLLVFFIFQYMQTKEIVH